MTTELPLPIPLKDWLKEREANCLRIAKTKTGADKAGWLEDARYFSECIEQLCRPSPAADEGAMEIPAKAPGTVPDDFRYEPDGSEVSEDAINGYADGWNALRKLLMDQRQHSAVSPKAGREDGK